MSKELQPLLEQIRKEGVDQAAQEAAKLIDQAKEKAAQLVQDAEIKANALVAKAEADSEIYTQRSVTTLKQAARDVLITVGQGVANIQAQIVGESVGSALRIEVLEQMMIKMAQSCAKHHGETRIELLISQTDQAQLIKFFDEKYREKMIHGIELRVDNEVLKGFRVRFADDHVYLDFTQTAIAEALTAFLRPKLAEIVNCVVKD